MPAGLEHFIHQALRRVLYYRTEADANINMNWPGFHDVGQGVELGFDAGSFFITWDTATEEEMSIHPGRMVDFLNAGLFEDVSKHADWQAQIGQPLEGVQLLQNEVALQIGGKQVFIVTAAVDPECLQIEARPDNLVVFCTLEARNAFFAQYPDTQRVEFPG